MSEDLGKLLLRLGVGGLALFHGVHNLLDGPGEVRAVLAANHMSAVLANAVYVGEVIAPAAVILGLFTRIGGAIMALTVLTGVWLSGFAQIADTGIDGAYALEAPAFYFVAGVALMLLGAGRLSLGGGRYA